jgi:hypothetical protein
VSDERLIAAVNVSRDEEDNFLAPIDEGSPAGSDGHFRTLYAEFNPDADPRTH